jgi:energy-coupling factor transport system ATP-binding protein
LNKHFIDFSSVSFHYSEQGNNPQDVINSISCSIDSGEYIAIVGANGSGKSTLVKLIDGLLFPTRGRLTVGGVEIQDRMNLAIIRKQVGIVFQSPEDQIVTTTVEEEVAFGLENFAIPHKEMKARVRKILEGFDMWDIRNRPTYMLSGGQTQRLAVASVLAIQPSCIIFDESTSMLDPAARKNLLGLMKSFHNEGKTILHITHSMDEAAQADRILVLNKGNLVFDGSPTELFIQEKIDERWNLEYPEYNILADLLRKKGISIKDGILSPNDLISIILEHFSINPRSKEIENTEMITEQSVKVSGLSFDYLKNTPYVVNALTDVSLSVKSGVGHGLIGKTGSGKSTVLQHLNGLMRPQSGEVTVGNYRLNDENIQLKDIVQYSGLVMQNPENQFFEYFVGDEIAFGPKNVGFIGTLSGRVKWAMETVGLDFETFKDRPIKSLSGGEKRKTALASILALKPQLLLLDEPTAGLDPKSRKEVLKSFTSMLADKMTIIISTHNLMDIMELTETLTLLENGRSIISGISESLLCDMDLLLNHGIDPPFISWIIAGITENTKVKLNGIKSVVDLSEILVMRENALN